MPDQYSMVLAPSVCGALRRGLVHQQPRAAVDQIFALRQQPEPVAQPRIAAVGADDQVGLDAAAVRQHKLAIGRRARGRRIDDDLDPGARRRGGERIDDVLPHDAEHAAALPAVHRDQPVVAVAHFAGMGERRALDRGVIGADRLEHPQAVLVDVDARAGGAQPVAALMHAHAPAALRQRAGRGEAGKAGADDLGMSLAHGRLLMAVRLLSWLRTGRSQPERRIYPWPVCAISPSA